MFQLQPTNQAYQGKNYKLLKDSQDSHYLAERIANIGVLDFGTVTASQKKRIDLAAKGMLSPVIILSVYAFSGDTANDEIRFNLYRKDSAGVLDKVAYQKYDSNKMPYRFPHGAVLTPDLVIEVEPRYNVDALLIYTQPCNVVFNISA